ncbi:MAG: hypothetical protein WD049_08040 [Candidatus Paceibacterota bacterium]
MTKVEGGSTDSDQLPICVTIIQKEGEKLVTLEFTSDRRTLGKIYEVLSDGFKCTMVSTERCGSGKSMTVSLCWKEVVCISDILRKNGFDIVFAS